MNSPVLVYNASSWHKQSVSSHLVRYSPKLREPEVTHAFSDLCQTGRWQHRYEAFAEVWVDTRDDAIFLVRDHFGCEPLYYHLNGKQFIFASTLPDLLKQLPSPPQWNQPLIVELLKGRPKYSNETYYKGVFRVEPGSWVHIKQGEIITKQAFWRLDPQEDDIHLANDKDYLGYFTELLEESVQFHCSTGSPQLAGELSGGLDASAILVAAHKQNVHYPLFMHVAPPGSSQQDDAQQAKHLLQKLNVKDARFIGADNFDIVEALHHCSQCFAGPASYIFPVLSYNITRTVAQANRTVLLSGAGGDECVSSHAPQNGLVPSLIKSTGFTGAWAALQTDYQTANRPASIIRRAERLLRYAHPLSFYCLSHATSSYQWIKASLDKEKNRPQVKPRFYPSLRALEWDRLQGRESLVIRGRVEDSAVLARSLGFEYRYPLLYPKLVEFCFRLPLAQKYRQGEKRYLIRQYLKKMGAPKEVYEKRQKQGGITPATLHKCLQAMAEGRLNFNPLPPYANQTTPHRKLISTLHYYMLSYAQTHLAAHSNNALLRYTDPRSNKTLSR